MGKSARLELRVEPEFKARVEVEAGRLGQKVSTFVERALEKALPPAGVQVSRGRVDVVLSSEDGRVLEQRSHVEGSFACPMGKCRRTADAPVRCPAHPHLTMKPVSP